MKRFFSFITNQLHSLKSNQIASINNVKKKKNKTKQNKQRSVMTASLMFSRKKIKQTSKHDRKNITNK